MDAITGGCLCGSLRYAVAVAPTNPHFCSCRQCQRWTGAPVDAWVDVPAAALRFDGPGGAPLRVVPVSVGNPHLVVLTDRLTDEELHRVGAHLVGHPALAHGANVQLASRVGPGVLRALIWERGVGPTSASGTSACAVAVAAVREGLEKPSELHVEMPGGTLSVTVSDAYDVVLRGPVEEVFTGTLLAP